MTVELCLSPGGRFYLAESDKPQSVSPDEAVATRWRQAFAASEAEGFLLLAAYDAPLPASLAFGRAFARRYLTALCQVPREEGADIPEVAVPTPEDWCVWIESAPPFRGMDYFGAGRANELWRELDAAVRKKVAATAGGVDAFLQSVGPVWRTVGRVTFHLAENKNNSARPFAFLVTYACRLSDNGRVQHLPLKRALNDYAGAKDRETLRRLLDPIQRAVEKSAFVKELFESGRMYQALAWTAHDAYRLLCDVPALESSGVIVRMPECWRALRRPPRPTVRVQLGERPPSRLGTEALLDFQLSVTVGEEVLTAGEIQSLVSSESGLVSLRGQWVEINREQLKGALEHWKKIEKSAKKAGVSFSEAMRLVSGVSLGGGEAVRSAERAGALSGVCAGRWFAETLARLRAPEQTDGALPCAADLHATLRPYQETGVRWLHFLASLGLGGCLADDMGLGKTIQTLALLLWLKRDSAEHAPSLLVAPASLLANWKEEARRFAPSLKLVIVHPSGNADPLFLKRCEADPAAALAGTDLVVTSYGMAARTEWLEDTAWRLVVLDEAQAIKNASTHQARAVKRLSAVARLALTGTPVENRVGDLWSLFDFINPGLLGGSKSFEAFMRSREDLTDAYAPVRRLTRPYILRRLKTDRSVIADLPEKTVMPAYCGLTSVQAALYARQVRQLKGDLTEGSLAGDPMTRRARILTSLMRFKQICNHPALVLADGDFAEARSGKFIRLRALCEEIAERQEKVLVFTQYREMTEPLANFLATVFRRPGLILHGGTPVAQRRERVDAFQRDDGPPFFVLSLKAGGTGLNLTQAAHVVHFDRWWNPAVENQATDRAFRIGQKKNVLVHTFICRGTVEDKIDALLEDKRALADEILRGGGETLLTEMKDDELLRFVELDLQAAAE